MSFSGGWPGAPTQIRALNLPAGREPKEMRHRLLGWEGTGPPKGWPELGTPGARRDVGESGKGMAGLCG